MAHKAEITVPLSEEALRLLIGYDDLVEYTERLKVENTELHTRIEAARIALRSAANYGGAARALRILEGES